MESYPDRPGREAIYEDKRKETDTGAAEAFAPARGHHEGSMAFSARLREQYSNLHGIVFPADDEARRG